MEMRYGYGVLEIWKYFIRSKTGLLNFSTVRYSLQVQSNDTTLKITIHHLCYHLWTRVLEFVEAKNFQLSSSDLSLVNLNNFLF